MLSWLSRWVWRLVVVAIILAAAIVSAGREMAPLLQENKSWLEANLTALTGTIVVMESASASWEGLTPELHVQHIKIGDDIAAESVLLRVDLLRSALSFALVFDTLIVSKASVYVPVDIQSSDADMDVRAYLEFLFGSADISINELLVVLEAPNGKRLPLSVGRVDIENTGRKHTLRADVSIIASGKTVEPATVQAAFSGNPAAIFEGKGKAYINLGPPKHIPELMEFLAALSLNFPGVELLPAKKVRGELWLDWASNHIQWKINTSIDGLTVKARKKTWQVDFEGLLAGEAFHQGDMRGSVMGYLPAAQKLQVNGESIALPSFAIAFEAGLDDGFFDTEVAASRMRVLVPKIQLETAHHQLRLLGYRELDELLRRLGPKGELERLSVDVPLQSVEADPAAIPRYQVKSHLKQVAVSAWQGAPALTGVDGYLQMDRDGGFVELASDDGFSMHYKTLYRAPMIYNKAHGRIYWQFDADDQATYVSGKDLKLEHTDGKLTGDFWLHIPASPKEVSELYLNLGLVNSNLRYRDKYLPVILPASLQSWLKRSIKAGNISDAGFMYRGPLDHAPATAYTYQFYANINRGDLQFDPRWPRLVNANAHLYVRDDHVQADVHSGRLLNIDVRRMKVTVDTPPEQSSFVTIRGGFGGPGNDVLRLFRETTLRDTFGSTTDLWKLSEELSGNIDIGFSLDAPSVADYQNVQVKFAQNDFYIGDINITLNKLQGQMVYSSTRGLSAPAILAELWGKQQNIVITPVQDEDGQPDIGIHINGMVDPADIARWSGILPMRFMRGDIAMGGDITIPLRPAGKTRESILSAVFYSDLQGVGIDLPDPIGKKAESMIPVSFAVDVGHEAIQYRVHYSNNVTGLLEKKHGQAIRGDIVLNADEPLQEISSNKLKLKGNFDRMSWEDWFPAVRRYKQMAVTQQKNTSAEADAPATAVVCKLNVKRFELGDAGWDNMQIYMDERPEFLNVYFNNADIAGNYRYYGEDRLSELDIDYYHIAAPEPAVVDNSVAPDPNAVGHDPLHAINPQDIPPLKVHVRSAHYGARQLGDWRFVTRPEADGLRLLDVYATMPGLDIAGVGNKKGAEVFWRKDATGQVYTEADGVAYVSVSKDPSTPGLITFIEAEETRLTGRVGWTGSPAMVSLNGMQGDVAIQSKKGRFLNSTPSTDAMRVINVFNFNSWARRLQLDFSDLYKRGVSYDKVNARVKLDRGKLAFTEPMVMEGPGSRFVMEGAIDSRANQIDATMVVTLPVSSNAAWIAGLAAGLPVAVGVWAVSKVFEGTIDNLSSISYTIQGSLDNPVVKFERLLPYSAKNKKEHAEPVDQKP